ncbi:MAG: redoxin domain-containing protein [Candidatus Aenigmarchaeota archaeon]|nr:redoxin domain-containing protein [Candidatus Aenigmarchaeota archaeon]
MKNTYVFTIPLLFLLLLISCNQERAQSETHSELAEAKDFTLESVDGKKKVSLEDFKGKPVVINFWASWCGPCKEEMPLFEKTWKKYKDKDVVFVGIDVMDDRNNAQVFLKDQGVTYTNLYDPTGEISNKYGVIALPATFFLDKEGKIVVKNYGPFIGGDGRKKFKLYLKEIIK